MANAYSEALQAYCELIWYYIQVQKAGLSSILFAGLCFDRGENMIQLRGTGAQTYSLLHRKTLWQFWRLDRHGLPTSSALLRPWLPGWVLALLSQQRRLAQITDPQYSAIQRESLLGCVETSSVFLIRLWCLKHRLVHIRVELLSTRAWVESV